LRLALVAKELLPISERDSASASDMVDDLSESIVWPVYPEIAARHGLQGTLQWRMGRVHNYKTIELTEFVNAMFKALAAKPRPQIAEALTWKAMLESLRLPEKSIS
jgi:hypothetical protein